MLKRLILTTLFFACFLYPAYPKVSKEKADSIANLLNADEVVCDRTCPLFESEKSNTGLVNTLFIDALVIIGAIWLFSNHKKKYILIIGALIVIAVTVSFLLKRNNVQCVEYSQSSCKVVEDNNKSARPDTSQALVRQSDISKGTSEGQIKNNVK